MGEANESAVVGADQPLVVVSSDTHIGPLLVEQLRPYCPKKYIDSFDEYVRTWEAKVQSSENVPSYIIESFIAGAGVANLDTPGHYDMDVRLKELDSDGVAAEVIFHASENGQPIPFRPLSAHFGYDLKEDPELAIVGTRIYNQWLADVCSVQWERHAGLAQLPIWNLEASVQEVEWARQVGLRGVNFPTMRADLRPYNEPVWEPLWRVCEANEMPLATHIGGGSPASFSGVEATLLKMLEDSHLFGYRAIHWLIFAGVFERHPGLKMTITEIAGDWLPHYCKLLDDMWYAGKKYPGFREQVPRPASEYLMENVYFGASFMAHFEAEAAVGGGYADRMMWGSDYPHIEGTWQSGFDFDGESATHLSLRNTFAGTAEPQLRQMLGETAIDVYGFDHAALLDVARRINSPTPAELASRPAELPKGLSTLAFRHFGTWT
jgi:predicted TIM-barrel fold metal-dependent hydrolase